MEAARTIRLVLAIAAACVPLIGALVLDWDVREVLLLYWAENLVIGFWQVVKMAAVSRRDGHPGDHLGKLFVIPFFIVHFGGFCAVHGVFIHTLSGHKDVLSGAGGLGIDAWGPLVFVVLLWRVISASLIVLPPAAFIAIGAMVVSHGLETWRGFFANGAWRSEKAGPRDLMFQPYVHIIVIHIAIIAGGAFAMWMKNAIPVLVIIIVGKLMIDWRGIVKGGEKSEQTGSSIPPGATEKEMTSGQA